MFDEHGMFTEHTGYFFERQVAHHGSQPKIQTDCKTMENRPVQVRLAVTAWFVCRFCAIVL